MHVLGGWKIWEIWWFPLAFPNLNVVFSTCCLRVWSNGRMRASQAWDEGSIPFTRSNLQKSHKINNLQNTFLTQKAKVRIKVRIWRFLTVLFTFIIYSYSICYKSIKNIQKWEFNAVLNTNRPVCFHFFRKFELSNFSLKKRTGECRSAI